MMNPLDYSSLIGAYSLLGAGSTLVPVTVKHCSLLSEILPFLILRSGKRAVIRIEAHFLFEECHSLFGASHLYIGAYFFPVEL